MTVKDQTHKAGVVCTWISVLDTNTLPVPIRKPRIPGVWLIVAEGDSFGGHDLGHSSPHSNSRQPRGSMRVALSQAT